MAIIRNKQAGRSGRASNKRRQEFCGRLNANGLSLLGTIHELAKIPNVSSHKVSGFAAQRRQENRLVLVGQSGKLWQARAMGAQAERRLDIPQSRGRLGKFSLQIATGFLQRIMAGNQFPVACLSQFDNQLFRDLWLSYRISAMRKISISAGDSGCVAKSAQQKGLPREPFLVGNDFRIRSRKPRVRKSCGPADPATGR